MGAGGLWELGVKAAEMQLGLAPPQRRYGRVRPCRGGGGGSQLAGEVGGAGGWQKVRCWESQWVYVGPEVTPHPLHAR